MGISGKRQGNQFEELFERSARRQCFGVLKIPDGCRRVGLNKIIPVKTPCDFILMFQGQSIFIDTKTQGAGQTFPTANINLDQVMAMRGMVDHGALGGYVCWFRDINQVVYYSCKLLHEAQEGLFYKDGVILGPIEQIDLKRILSHGRAR